MSASGNSGITRSQTLTWLIGQPEEHFASNVLPTGVDMMKTFHYNREILKKSVTDSRNDMITNLLIVWESAGIPTAEKRNVVTKFDVLLNKYNLVKKREIKTT